jgi:hypothetical protein
MSVAPSTRYSAFGPVTAGTIALPLIWPVNDAASDLTVTRRRAGVITVLNAGNDWFFLPNVGPPGGTVTLLQPALAGDEFIVAGRYVLRRDSNLTAADRNSTKKLNREFDRLWMTLQENETLRLQLLADFSALLLRAVTVATGQTPLVYDRTALAGKLLAADGGGELIGVPTGTPGATVVRTQIIDSTPFGRALMAVADDDDVRGLLELGTAARVDTGTGAAQVPTTAQADGRYIILGNQRFLLNQVNGMEVALATVLPFNNITIASGWACSDSIGLFIIGLAAQITKVTNAPWAAGTGAGAFDTGPILDFASYHVWAIARADGISDVLVSASDTNPTMPSGYIHKRRIAWFKRGDGFNGPMLPTWLLADVNLDTELSASSNVANVEVNVELLTFTTPRPNTWVKIDIEIPIVVASPTVQKTNGAARVYLDGTALAGNQWNGTLICNGGQWVETNGGTLDGRVSCSRTIMIPDAGSHVLRLQVGTSTVNTSVLIKSRRWYQVTLADKDQV